MYLGDPLILDYYLNSKKFTCSLFLSPPLIFKTVLFLSLPLQLVFCSLSSPDKQGQLSRETVSRQTLYPRMVTIKDIGILSPGHVEWGRGDSERGKDTRL